MKRTGQAALARLAIYLVIIILMAAASAVAEIGSSDKSKGSEEVNGVVSTGTNEAGNSIVVNTSRRGILAMCGTFDYVDPLTGETHRGATWKRSFVGPFIEMDLKLPSGGEYEFTPDPHPMRPDLKLYQINIKVTGVLLEGGTALGTEGEYIREKVQGLAHDTRLQLMEIRDILKRKDMKDSEELVLGFHPIVSSGRMREYIHLKLQQHLVTWYPPRLQPEYMERLEGLISHLGSHLGKN